MPKKAPTPDQAQRREWQKELRSLSAQIRQSETAVMRLSNAAIRKEAALQRQLDALRSANAKDVRRAQSAHEKLKGRLAKRSAVLEGRLHS